MRSSASHDALHQLSSGVSRVKNLKNLIANSPLRRRRALSQSIDSGLYSTGRGVFGVPLVTLVTTEGVDVPKIIKRIVEHIEKYGLKEEGVYRINGSSKQIEKLKASFNTVGDADFTDVDVAAIAGLLKLFLREMPSPLIPPDIEAKMVDIQQRYPGEMAEEAAVHLRDCLTQLPHVELAVFKYIISHLSLVAQHSGENKMNAIALSIVFGPGIFHCGGGLQGMKLQGYANSVLCRFIAHYSTLFQCTQGSSGSSLEGRKGEKEGEMGGVDGEALVMEQSSESLTSPTTLHGRSPSSHFSPTSPPLPPSSSSSPPDDNLFLKRQLPVKKTKRRAPFRSWSTDTVEHPATAVYVTRDINHQRTSTTTPSVPIIIGEPTAGGGMEEENGGLSFSPFSSSGHASSSTLSPPTSPSPPSSLSLTPRSSNVMNSVIEGSVKKFLFGPPSPRQPPPSETNTANNQPPTTKGHQTTDVYGLLLPSNSDSTEMIRPHPQQSHDNHLTTDDVTGMTSEPGVKLRGAERRRGRGGGGCGGGRERKEEGKRNRKSVVVETDHDEGDTTNSEIQVFSRSEFTRGESSDVVVVVESGHVSNLVRQFNDVDDIVASSSGSSSLTPSHHSQGEEMEVVKRRRMRKMDNKLFDKYEQSGMARGTTTKVQSPSSPTQPPPTAEPTPDPILHHPSPSLEHMTKTRPKGPVNRRLPSQKPGVLSPSSSSSTSSSSSSSSSTSATLQAPMIQTDRREREEERDERRKEKVEKEEMNTLNVPGVRRQRKSPRRERKRKPTPYTQPEVGPEDSATTSPVLEGWKDEREEKIMEVAVVSRPSNPVPPPDDTLTHPPHLFSPPSSSSSSSGQPQTKRKTHKKEKHEKPGTDPKPPESAKREYVVATKTTLANEETDSGAVLGETELRGGREEKEEKRSRETERAKELVREREHEKKKRKKEEKEEEKEEEKKKKGDVRGKDVISKKKDEEEEEEKVEEDEKKEGELLSTPELEDTLKRLMNSLMRKRASNGRPHSLEEMTNVQLADEKNAVQRTLLHFEKVHGRPSTLADKELMRPLYERYREVKKLLATRRSTPSSTTHPPPPPPTTTSTTVCGHLTTTTTDTTVSMTDSTLPSITLLTSGLAHSLPLESGRHSSSLSERPHPQSTSLSSAPPSSSLPTSSSSAGDRVTFRKKATPPPPPQTKEKEKGGEVVKEKREEELRREGESSNITTLRVLYGEQEEALEEKRRLRKILKDFENEFTSTHGRAPTKDDRLPRQQEYQEYKAVKEKLLKISNDINRNTLLQKTM